MRYKFLFTMQVPCNKQTCWGFTLAQI